MQAVLDNFPAVNETITVAKIRNIVKGLKNSEAVRNDDVPGEVYNLVASHILIAVPSFSLAANMARRNQER